MEAVHILRLRRFAEHLTTTDLKEKYNDLDFLKFTRDNQLVFHDNKYYQCLPWFEEELDYLFPAHFTRNRNGIVHSIKNPGMAVIYTLPEFFHLNTSQFNHCFLIAKQSREWGRFRMVTSSTPLHCGRILFQFIRNMSVKLKLEENLSVRRVLFEKIGKASPESILRSLYDLQ